MVRVYVDGVFDIFHYGHAEMLSRARDLFSPEPVTMIVGVCSVADCKKYKRNPLMTATERGRSVIACRYVDEVIADAPWIITQEFLDANRIDYVCHDSAPYPTIGRGPDVYAYVKSIGKFKAVSRTPDISTNHIIHLAMLREGAIEYATAPASPK
jgi:choline-phosphate cytidylyltransferase